jgi:hypothetical protein
MSYAQPVYKVDILDSSLNYKATVRNLVKLNDAGFFLSYTNRLSDWGTAKFRIGTDDPLLASEGDILQPFRYHVRIKRSGVVVWQGVIVKNPTRNKRYVEVVAYTYLYLLSRTLIKHDAADGQGAENFRTFNGATMASYINTLITEAKATMGAPLTSLTAGTIDNPTFPADFKDSAGTTLSGTWTFSPTFPLKVDYRDFLYVLTLFATYANCDFEITAGFALNFQSYIGNKQPQMTFTYGVYGNIEDYNAPLDGDAMANYLQGVAADNQSLIIHAEQSDNASIVQSGRIDGVAGFGDVKSVSLLNQRLRQQLNQVKTADPELHFYANDRAYPLGQYGVGDTVHVKIRDGVVNVDTDRRIVGIDVEVHLSGKERIRIITNKPRADQ